MSASFRMNSELFNNAIVILKISLRESKIFDLTYSDEKNVSVKKSFSTLDEFKSILLELLQKGIQSITYTQSEAPEIVTKTDMELSSSVSKGFKVNYVDKFGTMENILFHMSRCSNTTKRQIPSLLVFVQSSGYGKTRAMFEVSKQTFVFYILCKELPHAYQTSQVMQHLKTIIGTERTTPSQISELVGAFFKKCAIYLRRWLLETSGEKSPWDFMLHQCPPFVTLDQTGHDSFWARIISMEIPEEFKTSDISSILKDVGNLPKVTFAFDEASALVEMGIYNEINMFRYIRRYSWDAPSKSSCFIMSDTNSKISNMYSKKSMDPSVRDGGFTNLYPAFTYFSNSCKYFLEDWGKIISGQEPFNWRKFMKNRSDWSLEILRIGRPLWLSLQASYQGPETGRVKSLARVAQRKITACPEPDALLASLILSRIPLGVSACSKLAERLVSNCMATCIQISSDRELVFLEYFSEPLLAMAAASQWSGKLHNALLVLHKQISAGHVNTGDQGEFVTCLLLLACFDKNWDQVGDTIPESIRVDKFISELCGHTIAEHISSSGLLNFTHFIRYNKVTPGVLKDALVRGAGILPPHGYTACDILIPFVTEKGNISAICIQVKNRAKPLGQTAGEKNYNSMKCVVAEYIEPKDAVFLVIDLSQGQENGTVEFSENSDYIWGYICGLRRQDSSLIYTFLKPNVYDGLRNFLGITISKHERFLDVDMGKSFDYEGDHKIDKWIQFRDHYYAGKLVDIIESDTKKRDEEDESLSFRRKRTSSRRFK
jgi:hypothetical protein